MQEKRVIDIIWHGAERRTGEKELGKNGTREMGEDGRREDESRAQ